MRFTTLTSALVLTAATLVVTGCGLNNAVDTAATGPTSVTLSKMTGSVYGGRQPIGSAAISLYQTGTTGYGTGATIVPGATTTSNAAGGFSLPASTCTPGTYLYITAVGGDPYVTAGGTPSGENNTASYLLVALGPCSNSGNFGFVQMNELTTVATVYALAPFMSDTYVASTQTGAVLIGAPSTNQTGLANAFSDASTLVSYANGASPGANLPSGTTVPSAELNTMGDLLANCVNSISSASSVSSICTTIFTDSTPGGGTAASDVAGAMLNIARNPAHNVSTLIADSGPGAGSPYAPYISSANDLTVAVTYTTGISTPTAIATDSSGNVWITNAPSGGTASVTELSHTGVASNFTAGALNLPSAIAIDLSGNVWVANQGNSTLTELSSTGANVGLSPFSGGGLASPNSVAIDGSGNVWLTNAGSNSISAFNSSGTALSSTGYTATGVTSPVAIGINAH